MLIVTVNYPETSTTFIDRFLASAEAYRVPVKIIFNKVDAYDEEELHYLDSLINLYTTIGYPCFKVSARKGEGIDTIEKELKGRITLFSGHSGVGKSTLIKAILPDIEIKPERYPPIIIKVCTPLPSQKCSRFRQRIYH